MISPVKIQNYKSKQYYTDYFNDVIHPCLYSLQSKSIQFIENYFCIHTVEIGNVITNLRNYNSLTYYENQAVDYRSVDFFNYSQHIWPITTTEDGNCLFQIQFMATKTNTL